MRVTDRHVRNAYASAVEALAQEMGLECARTNESNRPYHTARITLKLSGWGVSVVVVFDGNDMVQDCTLDFHSDERREFNRAMTWAVVRSHGCRAVAYARDLEGILRQLRDKFRAVRDGRAFAKTLDEYIVNS